MIKRIIKWHKRRRRAMRIGMRWIETEEKIVGSLKLLGFGRGFAKGGFVGKSPSGGYVGLLTKPGELIMPAGTKHLLVDKPKRGAQITVDSRTWTGRY